MRSRFSYRIPVAIVLSLTSVLGSTALAEENAKKIQPQPLPLVNGEVVHVLVLPRAEILQLDTSRADVTLLKVRNRFGLEDAIKIVPGTTITRGGQEASVTDLRVGEIADIEYNLDFQSKERTAVSVKMLPQSSRPRTAPAATRARRIPETATVQTQEADQAPQQQGSIFVDGPVTRVVVKCDFGETLAKRQRASQLDPANDVPAGSAGHLDLTFVTFTPDAREGGLRTRLHTAGAFPPTGSVEARYRLLFDADNNPKTGAEVEIPQQEPGLTSSSLDSASPPSQRSAEQGPPAKTVANGEGVKDVVGAEYELRLLVARNQAQGLLTISGAVLDYLDGSETRVSIPSETAQALISSLPRKPFTFTIPHSLLNLTADEVPVTVISQDAAGAVIDTVGLVVNQQAWQSPAHITLSSAIVGEPVHFTVTGLTPRSGFEVRIDPSTQVTASGLEPLPGAVPSEVKPSPSTRTRDLTLSAAEGLSWNQWFQLVETPEAPLVSDTTGLDGTFSGSFLLPTLSAGTHPIAAQDGSGQVASNLITCSDYYAERVTPTVNGRTRDIATIYELGTQALEDDREEEALAYLEEAYLRDPDQPRIGLTLAYLYSKARRYDNESAVLAHLNDVLVQPSNEMHNRLALAYTQQAYAAFQDGDWHAVVEAASQALRIEPDSYTRQLHTYASQRLLEPPIQGNGSHKSVAKLPGTLGLKPDGDARVLHEAQADLAAGRYLRAATALGLLIEWQADPSAQAWTLLAQANLKAGEWMRAMSAAGRALEKDPQLVEAYRVAATAVEKLYGRDSAVTRDFHRQYPQFRNQAMRTRIAQLVAGVIGLGLLCLLVRRLRRRSVDRQRSGR